MSTAMPTPPEAPVAKPGAAPPSNMAAFEFVQALTGDLNKGTVELPSFPDIAMKVKRVLEDENTTSATIARVISSEPGLASRVLKMANSAANQRGGNAILDIPRAVGRLGHAAIRTLAVSFALQNVLDARKVTALKPFLNDLWNHSVHVAAISRSLAKRLGGMDADESMFVGLIHGVGKLYILTRIEDFPALFDSEEAIAAILEDWHVAIGQSIVENWGFAQPLIDAVAGQNDDEPSSSGKAQLGDVLRASTTLCRGLEDKAIDSTEFFDRSLFRRVDLTPENYGTVMEDSAGEINAMMAALNG